MLYYIYYNDLSCYSFNTVIIYTSLDFIIINTALIYFMKNPVYSLILLVLNYLLTGFLFIYNGLVFIGLIFILIYSGAISVLLIFTFMLLDIRVIYYKSMDIKYLYNFYFILFFIQIAVYIFIEKNNEMLHFDSYLYEEWFDASYLKTDFVNLSYEIFINNTNLLPIIALLLTCILIGSTSLVNSFKDSKKQQTFKQLKRYNKNIVDTN